MAYKKRLDGRDFKEMRPISAEVGVIKNADGSARFRIGETSAFAAVYGPRELHPKFMQDPKKGVLRCEYNIMPFSGTGNRIRPGNSRRSTEISMVTTQALSPVVNLEDYPNSVVDVFIELDQMDAGSRCAGICAASMALADAGIQMKDLVSSVAMGSVDGQLVVDLNYDEEAYEDGPVADIPFAIIPSTGEVTLLQMDGELEQKELLKAIDLAREKAPEISEIEKEGLKKKLE